jgi:hypothetical protein
VACRPLDEIQRLGFQKKKLMGNSQAIARDLYPYLTVKGKPSTLDHLVREASSRSSNEGNFPPFLFFTLGIKLKFYKWLNHQLCHMSIDDWL